VPTVVAAFVAAFVVALVSKRVPRDAMRLSAELSIPFRRALLPIFVALRVRTFEAIFFKSKFNTLSETMLAAMVA
jgi:hypothetical protein